jgi:subtilisin family serine protease
MRTLNGLFVIVLILFISLFCSSNASSVMSPDGQPPSFVGYSPLKIMVKFKPAALGRINRFLTPIGRTGIPAVDKLAQDFGASAINKKFPGAKKRFLRGKVVDLSGWYKVKFHSKVDIQKVVAAFKKLNDVINVQPVGIHAIQLIPNDNHYGNQWYLNQSSDRDIDAPEAWAFETGKADITVAVLDTGVQWFHNDLGGSEVPYLDPPGPSENISDLQGADGNMWINWEEANGQLDNDDDGNGFIDDMIGWDFVNLSEADAQDYCNRFEDCSGLDNDPRDFQGHGTHVAGIIGALNNNSAFVASPAGGWGDGTSQPAGDGVKIMALRVGWMDKYFPWIGYVSMDFIADALYYADANGADIVNGSWGSSNTGGLGDAVDYFIANGGIIVHAAGNGSSATPDYLGSREDVVNVAATDQYDCKPSFSNYGTWIDISAPGVDIVSTWNRYIEWPHYDYVDDKSGTSMASPVVASVAALIWSQNPLWTADQVKMKLMDSTEDIYDQPCNSSYGGQLGSGRVNAYLAVGSCEGDYDGDGDVDGDDLEDLIDRFGCKGKGKCQYDLNYDGEINNGDLGVLAKDFGRTECP